MANYSTHLGLKKPSTSEPFNIDDFNNNADIVDSEYYNLKDTFDQKVSDVQAAMTSKLDSSTTSLKTSLNNDLNKVKIDYIVQQGTSGIWTYRKWNSGIAECWGREIKYITVNTEWDNSNRDYISVTQTGATFPLTFTSIAYCFMSAETTSGDIATLCTDGFGTSNTKAPNYRLFRGAPISNKQYRINYQIRGRWK